MKNKYILMINVENNEIDKYKNDFQKNNYVIVFDQKNIIFAIRKKEKINDKEKEIINYIISIIIKYKFNGQLKIIDITEDMNSIINKSLKEENMDSFKDRYISWAIRQTMTKVIISNDINKQNLYDYISK